jgi:hypothetical protein
MYKARIITFKSLIGYLKEANIELELNPDESSVAIIKITADDVMNYNDELETIKQALISLISNSYLPYEGFYIITTMEI